ncbi:hypothetical protein RB195_019674 [Necator americanus]|uniref:Enoyl-CoA hydratase/isomerase family protein n=1 Tax=Necator americanus TaxID=51031 RepID=A0ABR1CF88_NECAM
MRVKVSSNTDDDAVLICYQRSRTAGLLHRYAFRMSHHIDTKKVGNVYWIRFNRPEKYNAISSEMYRDLITAFEEAENDQEILITVLTGNGKYYSAGSDFSFAELEHMRENDEEPLYKQWVDKIIRHSKLLMALINGPAIGVACTTLALCDVVLASDQMFLMPKKIQPQSELIKLLALFTQAYFHCPFTDLGLNPEGASSYTFVQIMGYQKAVRLALLAEKMSAHEACDAGLVTKVIPQARFEKETIELITKYSKLAHQSVIVSKRLLRTSHIVDDLLTINRKECEVLMKQFTSDETIERMTSKFLSKI